MIKWLMDDGGFELGHMDMKNHSQKYATCILQQNIYVIHRYPLIRCFVRIND